MTGFVSLKQTLLLENNFFVFLKSQIVTIEREIGRIVYELYGLTEEEIKVVEGEQSMTKEKNRKLSAKEQRRLNVFEETRERLSQNGYKKCVCQASFQGHRVWIHERTSHPILHMYDTTPKKALHLGRIDALYCSRYHSYNDRNSYRVVPPFLDRDCNDTFGWWGYYDCLESDDIQKIRQIQRSSHIRPSHSGRICYF